MSASNPRGQGTLELAIGALIFITVLVFGIHFGEIGMMKLRVQQAGASALWDTTGMRTHRLDAPVGSPPQFYSAPEVRDVNGRTSEEAARLRFQDFEGLSDGGSTTFTQVMTRGALLNVQCTPMPVSPLPNTDPFNRLRASYTLPNVGGREADGMACSASARLQVWGLPTNFLENSRGGFFKVNHSLVPQIQVCAIGRARGGVCQGRVLMALDDWGLAGSNTGLGRELESCRDDCLLNGVGNQAYKRTVERLYERYNSFAARDFAIPDFIRALFTQDPVVPELSNVPVDETAFRFAFVGEEGPDLDGSGQPFALRTREQDTNSAFDHYWSTTPYDDVYRAAYRRRGRCFLGSPCTRSYFDKSRW